MERLNKIVAHPLYLAHRKVIESFEGERPFCGHDLQHFLDVSRIGYILVLEHGLQIPKEIVYAFGFLHDIGRDVQYLTGEAHNLASLPIAEKILQDTGFEQDESALILKAIEGHRKKKNRDREDFEGLMYRADKASRACYNCKAETECNWSKSKKNLEIEV